jgi:hypothetical protein
VRAPVRRAEIGNMHKLWWPSVDAAETPIAVVVAVETKHGSPPFEDKAEIRIDVDAIDFRGDPFRRPVGKKNVPSPMFFKRNFRDVLSRCGPA